MKELTDALDNFFSMPGKKCLFAGAGVSAHAGAPNWKQYLEHLATVADKYEDETAVVIRKKIAEDNLILASRYYLMCDKIPEGVKYQELVSPFRKQFEFQALNALAALPFDAYVTTNYDRILHDAYSNVAASPELKRQPSPDNVELYDNSMKGATASDRFFIARIHGRIEDPTEMVLDDQSYKKAYDYAPYRDFIGNIFKNYHCLFVGFSFLDPGIHYVFESLHQLMPQLLSLHTALLPSDVDPKLKTALTKINIHCITYPHDNKHDALWDSIRESAREWRMPPQKEKHFEPPLRTAVHKMLASHYARLKISDEIRPLQQISYDTIVSSVLHANHGFQPFETIVEEVSKFVSLPTNQLRSVIKESLERLMADKRAKSAGNNYELDPAFLATTNDNVDLLRQGLTNRMGLLMRKLPSVKLVDSGLDILLDLLVQRGWDLGAHFARGTTAGAFDAWEQIEKCVEKRIASNVQLNTPQVKHVILDLLLKPDTNEAKALAEMGRLAFGIHLIIGSSNSTLTYEFVLPKLLFLDANVLMPLIVSQHPYSRAYQETLVTLRKLAIRKNLSLTILVLDVFLNEIIAHRQQAISIVNSFDSLRKLKDYIFLAGTTNINVFLGAYSSVLNQDNPPNMNEFLDSIAPYRTEQELKEFLLKSNIQVQESDGYLSEKATKYFEELCSVSEQDFDIRTDAFQRTRPKQQILIKHEAVQLARLDGLHNSPTTALFVTADKRLLRHVNMLKINSCASMMIASTGLVQLVDVFEGLSSGSESLGKLLLNIQNTDTHSAIRDLIIHKALESRDEAMSMSAFVVAERVARDSLRAAEDEGFDLLIMDPEVDVKLHDFFDNIERDFHKNMLLAVEDFKKRYNIE